MSYNREIMKKEKQLKIKDYEQNRLNSYLN